MTTVPSSRALVSQLKGAEQDFEFYPTTGEIIKATLRDINLQANKGYRYLYSSVLDIGAGNGKVLKAFSEDKEQRFDYLHAIEKSPILCAQLDADIMVVGTDFYEQSLLSKRVDIIFCNPPYSEFEDWTEKIIREAGCKLVYLVIPQRWNKSVRITDALRWREAEAHSVGEFDFENAEDRTARAVVSLLRIEFDNSSADDAFTRFFDDQFAELINKFKASEARPDGEKTETEYKNGAKPHEFTGLVVGPNYPEAIVSVYNGEMAKINRNYQLVGQLDVSLLKEFNIEPASIMKCLKERLTGLKNDYWMELFSHMSAVTDRLTSKSRKQLLGRLHEHVQVDFTVSNIYQVVLWLIKNANLFIDSQLLEVYELMVAKCNVQLYKSNTKVWVENRWRYGQDEKEVNTHYALDYRIVTHRIGGIRTGYTEAELAESAADFIGDLRTLARNLGFTPFTPGGGYENRLDWHGRRSWRSGQSEDFYYSKVGGSEMLFDVKAFKNGNLHLRLNQDFMLALNVEHGRLKGWLRTGQQAAEELQNEEAVKFFNANQLLPANATLLLT